MPLTVTPPAVVKEPPATSCAGRSPDPSGSHVASENTCGAEGSLIPLPKGCHAAPSQRATRFTITPPASTKLPPATSCSGRGPDPSGSHVVSERTKPFTPLPKGCHAAPSQRAMPFTVTPPAVVNSPPTTSCAARGPDPSGSHVVVAFVVPSTPGAGPHDCHDGSAGGCANVEVGSRPAASTRTRAIARPFPTKTRWSILTSSSVAAPACRATVPRFSIRERSRPCPLPPTEDPLRNYTLPCKRQPVNPILT